MQFNTIFGAKSTFLKAEFGTAESEAAHDAYLRLLIESSKTELEAERIMLSDIYLSTGWCDTQGEADNLAGVTPEGQWISKKKESNDPELQKGHLDFHNERAIKAIAAAGHLTNFDDKDLIYEWDNIRVITRSGEYILQRGIYLKGEKYWSTFYDSRVLSTSYDYEKQTYTETRKKMVIHTGENYLKSTKQNGLMLLKYLK
ncbi:MAG: hypothetical protein WC294_02200 [Methanoregula sp.]|jgi:hypothetical protein